MRRESNERQDPGHKMPELSFRETFLPTLCAPNRISSLKPSQLRVSPCIPASSAVPSILGGRVDETCPALTALLYPLSFGPPLESFSESRAVEPTSEDAPTVVLYAPLWAPPPPPPPSDVVEVPPVAALLPTGSRGLNAAGAGG